MKNLTNLTKMEYNYEDDYNDFDILGNLDDMLEDFENESYSKNDYICDVIGYIAEDFTPMFNHEIWKEASKIYEYIEDSIQEVDGLIDGNLMSTFQYGIQRYNELGLYENLEELKFNVAIEYLDAIYEDENKETQEVLKGLTDEDIINRLKGLDVDNKIVHIYSAIKEMVGDLRC